MRAAVLESIPSMLEVGEVQVDRPHGREVLVRTAAAGLCHSDLHFMEGKYNYDTPTVPGHEVAGIVEAVGDEVVDFKPEESVGKSLLHAAPVHREALS
jgi:S-(hydroxymethyl)glutathione dehydrogenase/alcohol dehydrogenase